MRLPALFPGQEHVARTHYEISVASLPRRRLFQIESPPGQCTLSTTQVPWESRILPQSCLWTEGLSFHQFLNANKQANQHYEITRFKVRYSKTYGWSLLCGKLNCTPQHVEERIICGSETSVKWTNGSVSGALKKPSRFFHDCLRAGRKEKFACGSQDVVGLGDFYDKAQASCDLLVSIWRS